MKRLPRLRIPVSSPPGGKRIQPPTGGGIIYILVMLLVLWLWQDVAVNLTLRTLPYSDFKQHVARREVVEATVRPDEIIGRIVLRDAAARPPQSAATDSTENSTPPGFLFRTVRVEDPDLVRELQAAGVRFAGVHPGFLSQALVSWVIPIAVMAAVWIFISRKMAGGAQSMLSLGRARAHLVVDSNTGVTFKDVAGCDEAKLELSEVVDFLKNPQRYQELGARIPKGVLLVGPPGTGKTLLARAVAGEAGVPFFNLSGSDFVEMFVGLGAARVRDLFRQAKEHAPCIVFIDELDAIGRQRGVHVGTVNDEREQTLNALLVELDGFAANTGVILLAATNRPEVLDRALLRPGRFDRQVVVDAPDLGGREAILNVHARDKRLANDVDLRRIAAATAGLSGADLANMLNEAALLAARREGKAITQHDIEEALEKVVAGPQRRSRRLKEEEKQRVAYHEVGHALVAAHSKSGDPVHRISIVPRGKAALGYTLQLPTEDQFLLTRSELLARIRALLGGRAAEDIVFHEVSTGAQNDLERATALARQMVAWYGMSDRVGLAHCAHRAPNFLGTTDGSFQRDCSEQTAWEIDDEVKRVLAEAYHEAKQCLLRDRDLLERVTKELLARETLDGATFYRLLEEKPARRCDAEIAELEGSEPQARGEQLTELADAGR
jgi:cell division protease FtsH